MKKKIGLLVAAGFILMGTVSAASLWGSYKGNPVIKVNMAGTEVKYDKVPAFASGGQVMIPITTLKNLGVKYTYDSKKLTANITKPEDPVDADAVRAAPISWLQLYYTVSNDYWNLKEYDLQSSNRVYEIGAIVDAVLANRDSTVIQKLIDGQHTSADLYKTNLDNLKKRVNDTIVWAKENELDMTNMQSALTSLDKSRDLFDKALSSAESYYKFGRNKNYGDDYIYYIDTANKERQNAYTLISNGIQEYFDLIQNYK